MKSMTLERILAEFEGFYGSKPRAVYALDEDYSVDKGLIPLRDPVQCGRVIDYLELLGHEEIQFFADHERDPMPTFVFLEMFVEGNDQVELEGKHGVEINREELGLEQNETLGVDEGGENHGDGVDRTEGGENHGDGVHGTEGCENHGDGVDVTLGGDDHGDGVEENEDIGVDYVDITGDGVEADHNDSVEPEVRIESDSEHDENSSVYSEEFWESDDDDSLEHLLGSVEGGEQGRFELGMTFAGAKEAREALNAYAVKFGYKLKFVKNEKSRIRVICMNERECPFLMHISKDGDIEGLAVKTLVADHTCCKQREVPSASQSFLAKYFKEVVNRNPRFTSKDMQGHVKDQLKLHVSLHKCKRAKKEILSKLEGSYKDEFNRLVAYCKIVKECMPGSKMELQLSTEHLQNSRRVFKRIFVMLEPCK